MCDKLLFISKTMSIIRIVMGIGQYRSNKEKMPHKRVGTGLAPVRESVAGTRFWTGASPVPTRFSLFE